MVGARPASACLLHRMNRNRSSGSAQTVLLVTHTCTLLCFCVKQQTWGSKLRASAAASLHLCLCFCVTSWKLPPANMSRWVFSCSWGINDVMVFMHRTWNHIEVDFDLYRKGVFCFCFTSCSLLVLLGCRPTQGHHLFLHPIFSFLLQISSHSATKPLFWHETRRLRFIRHDSTSEFSRFSPSVDVWIQW